MVVILTTKGKVTADAHCKRKYCLINLHQLSMTNIDTTQVVTRADLDDYFGRC